jgi:hypothetical protein
MSLIPPSVTGTIDYLQSKIDPWTTSATAIGTTTAAVTALAANVAAAQDKLAAQIAAQEAAKAATTDLHLAIRTLRRAGADIVKQIRAKAATGGDAVYVLAQIPPPATPSPVPAPGTPTDFSATLNPDGSLKLRWKCPNPAGSVGTIYQVARRTGAVGPFAAVGGTGTRSFLDPTVPAAAAAAAGGVTYQVTAVRSTASGTPAQFTVNFGVGGGGEATASVVGAPKLAA